MIPANPGGLPPAASNDLLARTTMRKTVDYVARSGT